MSCIMERINQGKFVLIAEIGVNYYDIAKKEGISNMEAAKLMVREAKKAGVHAVKFQSYKARTLAAKDSPAYWDTRRSPLPPNMNCSRNLIPLGRRNIRSWLGTAGGRGLNSCLRHLTPHLRIIWRG